MSSVQSHKHYIYTRCCPGQVGRWNLIVACGMLKLVYFAFVKTMLEFFANDTFCSIMSTFAKTKEENNRDDSFETRHFDEGRPCGERPCTLLVQRSRMLMQKRPLFKQSKRNLNNTDSFRLYWVRCSLLKKDSVIKHTIEQYTVTEVNVNSYDIR